MRVKNVFILWLFCAHILYADLDKNQQREIDFLLSYVSRSPCIFNRNGINYKGSEAITHIKRKQQYFKDEIQTTEDFIALAATKSEISGRKYTVKCTGTERQELGKWLLSVLKSFRKDKQRDE